MSYIDETFRNGRGQRTACIGIESHPKDARYVIRDGDTNQTIVQIMCHDAAHGGLVLQNAIRG